MGIKRIIRDVDANEDVQELVENGYFAEEISFYGCAYALDHRIYFRIHENEKMIRTFVRREEEAGNIFPTLVDIFYKRVKIPSGMREAKKEEARMELLIRMKKEFPVEFFRALMPLAETPANDSAAIYLKRWMHSLFCCFDPLELQLFEGALKACRQGKLLGSETYGLMKCWCDDRWMQIHQQNRARGAYSRQFSGFAYWKENHWQMFSDADALVVWRHYEQALKEGQITTPVVQQRYELDTLRVGDIQKTEEIFLQELANAMTDRYFLTVKHLHALPSAISSELLQRQREMMKQVESIRAQETFSYWLTKWHCFE